MIYHETTYSFLNLFSFYHVIEDQRTDLDETKEEDFVKIKELGYKYKHRINIKFLWFFKYHAILHSINLGLIWDNDEAI